MRHKHLGLVEDIRISNPVTAELYRRGMTLSGYCRVRGINYGLTQLVICGYRRNEKIEKQLKRDGLFHLIPELAPEPKGKGRPRKRKSNGDGD